MSSIISSCEKAIVETSPCVEGKKASRFWSWMKIWIDELVECIESNCGTLGNVLWFFWEESDMWVCVCVGSLGHHLGEFFVSAIYWRICLPFSMCLFSFHSSFAFGSSSCQKTTTRELDKYKDYLRFVQTPLGGHGGLWVARSPMFASVDAGASMGCLLRSFHFDAGDNQELW